MESQKYSTGTVQYDKGLPTPIPRMMPRAGMLEWRILEFDWDAMGCCTLGCQMEKIWRSRVCCRIYKEF